MLQIIFEIIKNLKRSIYKDRHIKQKNVIKIFYNCKQLYVIIVINNIYFELKNKNKVQVNEYECGFIVNKKRISNILNKTRRVEFLFFIFHLFKVIFNFIFFISCIAYQ